MLTKIRVQKLFFWNFKEVGKNLFIVFREREERDAEKERDRDSQREKDM
jgi:hypothetical protein